MLALLQNQKCLPEAFNFLADFYKPQIGYKSDFGFTKDNFKSELKPNMIHVYHEMEQGVWFYYKDGKWIVSVSLPSEIRVNMNNYVVLEMDSDKPYDYDHEVIKNYPPGQLKKKNGKHEWKDK